MLLASAEVLMGLVCMLLVRIYLHCISYPSHVMDRVLSTHLPICCVAEVNRYLSDCTWLLFHR
jgi:hypothetical protein